MKSEMCSSCAHTKVCFKDKNILGDVFVPGNPMLFDNQERFKEYEKRKVDGFPCDDYMAAPISKPATNGDKLRAMSDEELADEYIRIYHMLGWYTDSWAWLRKWLKSPAEVDK